MRWFRAWFLWTLRRRALFRQESPPPFSREVYGIQEAIRAIAFTSNVTKKGLLDGLIHVAYELWRQDGPGPIGEFLTAVDEQCRRMDEHARLLAKQERRNKT